MYTKNNLGLVCLLIPFVLISLKELSYGQVVNDNDSAAVENTLSVFRKSLKSQLWLFNGVEDPGYPAGLVGSPYYLTDKLSKGSVIYDGVTYHNVPLLYDMLKQAVVIEYFNTPFRIRLLDDRLSSFSFSGHHFVKVGNNAGLVNLEEGIFEICYSGSLRLLARRYALSRNVISGNKMATTIESHVKFYIIRDRTAYSVNSAKTALKIVGDNGEIKEYLKKNKFKYKKDKERVLTEIVSYRDNISR
ncbi:hypothetical protein BDE36_0259 [Arcticibacter tournemirensis]|uniref:Uncharacterized protein n=1 Tax=Arcticibacter tournemirensis TaxID=699437 RepID=A0A5M9GYG5_9SPHI|nr:hypothetical protein [Arcticibacter tournemirensis]KAA8478437.1 hypothetical protein F1649_17765 [Arcticibacter tournemirensis]TQM48572.1 hypothetical protein BDE36_0259 [Arcticibacter tournemirensis]